MGKENIKFETKKIDIDALNDFMHLKENEKLFIHSFDVYEYVCHIQLSSSGNVVDLFTFSLFTFY